jgi:hypothetical protein
MSNSVESMHTRRQLWILSKDTTARIFLAGLVACFYSGAVLINNELIFFWASDESYRYWLYPPAGLRLILILLLGWPGVIGYFLAALAINYSDIIPVIDTFDKALIIAAVRALSLWFGVFLFGKITGVKRPWDKLSWWHIPFLALFVNLFSSILAHITRYLMGIEGIDEMVRNIALNVFGDLTGTILIIYLAIRLRRAYVRFVNAERNPKAHKN